MPRLARAAFLLASGLLSACAAQQTSPAQAPITYVALGDSLTAGYQSGGLRADFQRDAYPAVLSRLSGLAFGMPLTRDPGCPPPLGATAASTSCQRLNPQERATNFAVPGATVADLLHKTSGNAGQAAPLHELILGRGETQVSAANKAAPDLVTLWIGANDVLGAALAGDPARATPVARFEQEYGQVLRALRDTGAQLVVLTIPDVTQAPALVPGAKLHALGLGGASCRASANRVSVTRVLSGSPVACDAPYALTPEETLAVQRRVAEYNQAIRKVAGQYEAKVFDVSGVMRPANATYDLSSPAPFGADYSLDGIHPSSAGHARLARALAEFLSRELNLGIPLPGVS